MRYERLTIPDIKIARCKNTYYTQQEELDILRQRLYELENKIDNNELVFIPGIVPLQIPVYKQDGFKSRTFYKCSWWTADGDIASSIEPTLDLAERDLKEIQKDA